MNDDDDALRDLLRTLSPSAREHFREVLIQDQADRDAIAARLLRYRDECGTASSRLVAHGSVSKYEQGDHFPVI